MNSDYILKGKGQITLHKPDWASVDAAQTAPQDAASSPSFEKTLEQASTQDTDATATQNSATPPSKKTTFNEFTHSGSNKYVGPGVDTVDYTLDDFIDTINPLQQIPIVNMIYRELTGDKIKGVAQVAGSALYWGPLGIVTGAIDAIFIQEKGQDMGETIIAGIFGKDTPASGKNAPASSPIEDNIQNNGTTMLAENANDGASKTAALPTQAKPATKQAFGGVIEPKHDADTAAQIEMPSAGVIQTETAQAAPKLVDADGQKLYSLAGIHRHVGSPARMPVMSSDDVRFKSYGKAAGVTGAKAGDITRLPNIETLPPVAQKLQDMPIEDMASDMGLGSGGLSAPGLSTPVLSTQGLSTLGLSNPISKTAAQSGTASTSNPIPAQLIQDMMMLNMQKYQDGVKNGNLRGNRLDIQG